MNGRQFKKLAALGKKVPKDTTLPSLNKLYYIDGSFRVTNLDLSVIATPPEGEIDGNVPDIVDSVSGETQVLAVTPKSFGAFATKLSVKDNVQVSVSDNGITVTRGKVSKNWNDPVSMESVPTFPDTNGDFGRPVFSDNSETVVNLLRRLDPMVARDDYRPALNGVYLDTERQCFVATNGHVLGKISTAGCLRGRDPDEDELAIRKSLYPVLKKIKPVGDLTIYYNTYSKIAIKCSDAEGWDYLLIVRLIEGPFPPYYKVFPSEHNYRAEFVLPLQALEDVGRFMGNGSAAPQTVFHFDNPRFTYHASEDGETTVKVDTAITFLDSEFDKSERIGFNPNFLGGVIGKFFNNSPVAYHVSPTQALTLKDDTDESVALIMPIKLPRE